MRLIHADTPAQGREGVGEVRGQGRLESSPRNLTDCASGRANPSRRCGKRVGVGRAATLRFIADVLEFCLFICSCFPDSFVTRIARMPLVFLCVRVLHFCTSFVLAS